MSFTHVLARLPCCTCVTCEFFSDNFDRTDADDPGAYTEVSGDWDIVSNKLSTASDDGVLIIDAEHPDTEPNIKVSTVVNIATNGDIARIILDYADSSNYWFAEIKAGTGAYIRIYQRSGGTNTQKRSSSITLPVDTYGFCASIIDGTTLLASVGASDPVGSTISYHGTFTNPTAGLGTGTIAGTVTFDDLVVSKTSADCPPCTSQSSCTDCDNDPNVADEVLVEFAGVANNGPVDCANCATLNTIGVVVTRTNTCRWEAPWPVCSSLGTMALITTGPSILATGGFTIFNPNSTLGVCFNNFPFIPNAAFDDYICDWSGATATATSIPPP